MNLIVTFAVIGEMVRDLFNLEKMSLRHYARFLVELQNEVKNSKIRQK